VTVRAKEITNMDIEKSIVETRDCEQRLQSASLLNITSNCSGKNSVEKHFNYDQNNLYS